MDAPYDSYEQNILSEDVQDEVYIISPVDNPVCSMSRSIRATATLHQWSEDALVNPMENAVIEGAAATFGSSAAVIKLKNSTQIMDKTASITGTLEEVDKYGRDSEMAYQLELRYGELANDEEIAVMGAFNSTTGVPASGTRQAEDVGAVGTARKMASLYNQLDASVQIDGSGIVTATVGGIDALEDLILDAHEACYTAGANPSYLVTSPAGSRYVSDFALSASRGRDVRNERRLVNVVDLYVSNFGELDVVLDRNVANVVSDGSIESKYDFYLLDFNYLATPVLRSTRDWAIAKVGDSEERQVLRESTFAVLNTKSQAVVHSVVAGLI